MQNTIRHIFTDTFGIHMHNGWSSRVIFGHIIQCHEGMHVYEEWWTTLQLSIPDWLQSGYV